MTVLTAKRSIAIILLLNKEIIMNKINPIGEILTLLYFDNHNSWKINKILRNQIRQDPKIQSVAPDSDKIKQQIRIKINEIARCKLPPALTNQKP